MPFEWLLVGIPIAFLLGWLAARLDIRHIRKSALEFPKECFGGVSYLLNKEYDRALRVFLKASKKVESSSLLFAIGKLSRQRGDYKLAMQVHQQLHEREDLSVEDRNQALWEMANDYYSMGFVDYAEQYAQALIDNAIFGKDAFDLLLTIYQKCHHYEKASRLIESRGDDTIANHRQMIAQLYCQCAEREKTKEEKEKLLQKALAINPFCVRATMALADFSFSMELLEKAIVFYAKVEEQNTAYLWLMIPQYMQTMRALNDKERGIETILRWLSHYPSVMLFQRVFDVLLEENKETDTICENFLLANKRGIAAAYWIEKQDIRCNTNALITVKNLLVQYAGKEFSCNHCGYETTYFTWSCPGCLKWETLIEQNK